MAFADKVECVFLLEIEHNLDYVRYLYAIQLAEVTS